MIFDRLPWTAERVGFDSLYAGAPSFPRFLRKGSGIRLTVRGCPILSALFAERVGIRFTVRGCPSFSALFAERVGFDSLYAGAPSFPRFLRKGSDSIHCTRVPHPFRAFCGKDRGLIQPLRPVDPLNVRIGARPNCHAAVTFVCRSHPRRGRFFPHGA